MNYRHHFHAGNFADVAKHALLIRLIRALQKKEKGILYLDTHAGRGSYDLAVAATGDSLARKPEWPDGLGRLWALPPDELPAPIAEYVELVRAFDRGAGSLASAPRFYPGSPWIARLLARPIDRLALCEKHPSEYAALRAEFGGQPKISVHEIDGYGALQSMLPPAERRALVLIDPPFEAQDEFAQIGRALGKGLRRFPGGMFVVWYPLTVRARVDEFFATIRVLGPPPTLTAELTIAGESSPIKMKGCGLLVINPPWQFDREAARIIEFLAGACAQAPGSEARVDWIVPEK
jgi:23S rRNA (adenine2030-N6)-methyltransferase